MRKRDKLEESADTLVRAMQNKNGSPAKLKLRRLFKDLANDENVTCYKSLDGRHLRALTTDNMFLATSENGEYFSVTVLDGKSSADVWSIEREELGEITGGLTSKDFFAPVTFSRKSPKRFPNQ